MIHGLQIGAKQEWINDGVRFGSVFADLHIPFCEEQLIDYWTK